MVKILIVVTNGLHREGITTTQLEFFRNMNMDGLLVDISATYNNDPAIIADFKAVGCNVIEFPNRKRQPVRYILCLYRILKDKQYDIIHVHGSSGIMCIELYCAKIAGVKLRIAHSRNTKTDHMMLDKLLRPVFNNSYNCALACGDEAGKWLFKNRDYSVIHNGKDLQKFSFDKRKRIYQRRVLNLTDEVGIGFVGNLNPQKNIPFLLEIIEGLLERNFNFKFFFIGDGRERKLIEDFINRYSLHNKVSVIGRVSNVEDYLAALDVMLLPSLFEGLPNVVLEWQASGLKSFISDKVTTECKVCDLVSFLPIHQGTAPWVDAIESINTYERETSSLIGCKRLIEAGFEISAAAEHMRNIYLDRVEE